MEQYLDDTFNAYKTAAQRAGTPPEVQATKHLCYACADQLICTSQRDPRAGGKALSSLLEQKSREVGAVVFRWTDSLLQPQLTFLDGRAVRETRFFLDALSQQ